VRDGDSAEDERALDRGAGARSARPFDGTLGDGTTRLARKTLGDSEAQPRQLFVALLELILEPRNFRAQRLRGADELDERALPLAQHRFDAVELELGVRERAWRRRAGRRPGPRLWAFTIGHLPRHRPGR